MSRDPFARAWIEIREDAVRRNFRRIREAVPRGAGVVPMVKADAYGLGLEGAVAALGPEGPSAWGVALVEEGERLRELGVRDPVVVFAPTPPGLMERAVEAGLTLSVSELELLPRIREAADRTGRTVGIQVEVDTGMGRAGFPWKEVSHWGPRLQALLDPATLRWEGCFTHFHSADQGEAAGGPASMEEQAARFRQVTEALGLSGREGEGRRVPGEAGGTPHGPREGTPRRPRPLLHLGNSAAALRRPELVGGAVRPGIFLYGGSAGSGLPDPEPTVSLRARVALVREVEPGATVGYGATYRAEKRERWATLAIGYGDGLPRALSNRGAVLLRGDRAPVVGRISMDMTVVDITHIPGVRPGEVATLLGEDGASRITVEEMAMEAGTINYEILTGFTSRLPRVWLPEGTG